jgi:hypothetical protein
MLIKPAVLITLFTAEELESKKLGKIPRTPFPY